MYIDTHAHITKKYYEDICQVIKEAKHNNVGIIINIGTNDDEFDDVIDIAKANDEIYGVIGYYPDCIEKINNLLYLEQNLNNPKVVAIGEIGLEYHNLSNKEEQRKLFSQQVELAIAYNLPIVVHSRDAINETYEILKTYKCDKLRGIIHCYSGSYEMAEKFIKLGFYLGIGGPYTFKNNVKGLEVIEKIPLEFLVLETDSPYLTPHPFRGTKNTPAYIPYIAEKIAIVKDIPVEKVMEVTTINALKVYNININEYNLI